MDLSGKTCLVHDNGTFVELAVRLSRDFGHVYYYCPWRSAFPRMRDVAIGDGVPGIERVYSLWDVIDKVDLFVFPDVLDGDLQAYLRSQGKRVWGSGKADWLELDRWTTLQHQLEMGIGTPATTRIVGVDALKAHLADKEDKWLKVSMFRGDFETFHHLKPFTSEPFLHDLAFKYGPLGSQVEFVVEDHVDGVELAYDGFTVDGHFPDVALFGYEVKDMGYVGHVKAYGDLPQQIREVNQAFAPILAEHQCRSFVSFEMRVGQDKIPVVIDPCMRCGSPPTEVQMELWSNFAEMLWEGADGRIVTPQPIAQYAVQAIIASQYAKENWLALDFPAELRRWVKVKQLCVLDGRHYYCPGHVPMAEIGSVVGIGNSLEEAIARVDEVAEQVQGYQVEVYNNAIDKARERIEDGEGYAIRF